MPQPHSRDKKVGSGSVGVGKGRTVSTGSRPVGGSSQSSRPTTPRPSGGNAGFGGGSNYSSNNVNRAAGSSGGSGKAAGALGLLALFAIIPKKFRKILLIAVAVILVFSFMRGGLGGGSNYSSSPISAIETSSAYSTIDENASMFPGGGLFSSTNQFSSDNLYGAGSSYSGGTPSGSTAGTGSGGLLQGLLGAGQTASTPKPTAAPKPTATPKPDADKPDSTVSAVARDKRVTPIGGGKDTVTIMLYMCGTDLESKYGMGTSDLSEMAKANISDKVNLIVETGGCKSWKNNVMSSSVNQIYSVRSGGVERLEDNFGKAAMTDPANLTKFIQYCNKNYPADRNILILWDHGGGSISGYGYDEKNVSASSMTLTKLNKALDDANCVFDWIGFDACLMSTLETALVCNEYADYLIASEETEPGTGWYYTSWLNALSQNTSIPTLELSKTLVDDYVKASRAKSYSAQVTLSVTDLAELQGVIPPLFRNFSTSTTELIKSDNYKQVSNARSGARQFAQSTRINQVDLADLALRIDTEESRALAEGIQQCVKYNGTTISRCYGLSIYFPYETLNSVSAAVNTYDSLGLDEEYTECIKSFASLEYGGQMPSYASQSSSYTNWGSSYGGSSSGSTISTSDLLQELMNAYAGGSSYGSSSGSSSYGSSGGSSLSSLFGSPVGSLSGSYSNSYGSQSAGYSISPSDIMGLLSAFGGRSLPAEYSWVDTDLVAESAERIANNAIDPGRITASIKGGQKVLELTDDEWSLMQSVELNFFVDDGEGYIDLGLDNTFEFNGNALILDHDGTWLTVDGQVVAYYMVSDTENDDGSWTTIGRIPALLNGELVNLQVIFDDDNPYGAITGAYPLYGNGETETAPKGCVPLMVGDTVEFLCDYYGYDGSYESSCTLGTGFTVTDTDFEIENLYLDVAGVVASYRLTDIYGNHYWIAA